MLINAFIREALSLKGFNVSSVRTPKYLGFSNICGRDGNMRGLPSENYVRKLWLSRQGFSHMGRIYGYSRVSTSTQDWTMQVQSLVNFGCDDRDIFREKQSGAKRDRQELRRVLDLLREGDSLVVYRLDRLARSQLHLLQIVQEVEDKGARLVSLNDNIDTSTATGKMILGVLGALAEMERNLILERSQAGIALAKQRGVRFGRPPKATDSVVRQVMLAHDDPHATVPEVCEMLGISRSTYYSALRRGRAGNFRGCFQPPS